MVLNSILPVNYLRKKKDKMKILQRNNRNYFTSAETTDDYFTSEETTDEYFTRRETTDEYFTVRKYR